jgi:hypothetical protein
MPTNVWDITHSLGKKPYIIVVVDDRVVDCNVDYDVLGDTNNKLRIIFNTSSSGIAYFK